MPNLQELVNVASSGATIQHDVEFVGNLVINKSLAIQGTGTIRTPNAGPATDIVPGTGPVTLRGGLKICTTPGWAQVYDIVRWGAWQTSVLADVPQGLTLEDVDIFGQPGQEVQRGIAANGANFIMRRSKVREVHGVNSECQAVAAWNGPGPFTIEDSYLEASHISILFGGAEAKIPNLVPRGIRILRTHFYRPISWRDLYPCKNHVEFKNAEDALLDGCVSENCWVSAQIGFSILLTVRNEGGLNPWAIVKNIRIQNHHAKNIAGGVQLIGKDTNAAGVAGAGDGAVFSNVLFELNPAMGSNGRLIQSQDFHNLSLGRVEANPTHSYLNLSGAPVPGLSITNSLLSQGQWGYFGDGDRPLSTYAPDGKVAVNHIYGPSIPEARKFPGNTYLSSKPSVLPSGVGVDYAALKAAQSGTGTVPPVEPIPPTPNPPADSIPVVTIVSPLSMATISGQSTISALATDPSGISEVYLIVDGAVITSKNATPYDFTVDTTKIDDGAHSVKVRAWSKLGKAGDSETITVTVKNVVEPPQPQPQPPRSVAWPKQVAKQNQLLDAQWMERYRLRAIREGVKTMAEFEHVN